MFRMSIWNMIGFRRRLSIALVLATSAWSQLCSATYSDAAGDQLRDFPFMIGCEVKDTFHAFYLSRISPDGLATYVASDRIAGTISLDGHAKAVGGPNGGNCLGKTLEQLRASGQARYLQP
jgi:hypothetical protein